MNIKIKVANIPIPQGLTPPTNHYNFQSAYQLGINEMYNDTRQASNKLYLSCQLYIKDLLLFNNIFTDHTSALKDFVRSFLSTKVPPGRRQSFISDWNDIYSFHQNFSQNHLTVMQISNIAFNIIPNFIQDIYYISLAPFSAQNFFNNNKKFHLRVVPPITHFYFK
jgi:hypothetical protein